MLGSRVTRGYLAGIALSALTFVALYLSPWNAGAAMLLIRLPPVIISAYIGGLRPGLLTGLLCLLGAAHSMLPLDDYAGREPPDALRLLTFAGTAVAISVLTEALHRARIDIEIKSVRFRELAETITEVFWMIDPAKHALIYISPAYEKVWGRTSAELQRAPDAWIEAVHIDDRDRVCAWGHAQTRQLVGPYSVHYRIVRPDGEIRWIHDQAFPIRDPAGEVIRIAGIARDVTEQRVLEDQLRQTQKLESIGLLAGGVAHDFNNILGAIAASSEMIADSLTPDDPNRELAADIDAAVSRATGMTRQLLAFSRKQVSEPIVIDVNRLVEDARRMLRRMLGENVIVEVSLDPELERIRCDPNQFVQVLMNLAINARDAMDRGGTLRIETRQDGRWVLLTVTDDGCGMTEQVRARVFEPFFTTKEVGRGTGLGLPVVHGIVQQAGGQIELDSDPGAGTTFRLRFPALAELAEPNQLDLVIAATRGSECILMVDDDWHLRTVAARALRTRGYAVLEAGDGPTALRLLEEHAPAIDLMITDVVMPGMDGRELAERARARMPELHVLFTSGYTEDEVVRRGIQEASLAFLEKPFRVHVLAAKVRQLLDDAAAEAGRGEPGAARSRLRIPPAAS